MLAIKGIYKRVSIANSGANISLFQFAKDALFFGEWSRLNAKNLSFILHCFEAASGLKINLAKSRLFSIGVAIKDVNVVASSLGCSHDVPPFSYLGLPIGKMMRFCTKWMEVIKCFRCKLSAWKANSLSVGGRRTLIKSILVVSFEASRNPNVALVGRNGKVSFLIWIKELLMALWRLVIKDFYGDDGGFCSYSNILRVEVFGETFSGLPRIMKVNYKISFMKSFGKHLEEKHVTWARFGKKLDENSTLGFSERGDGVRICNDAVRRDLSEGEIEEEEEVVEVVEVEEVGVEYFDKFLTKDELAYHKYHLCDPSSPFFKRPPIIVGGNPSNLKIPCNIGHVHVWKAFIDLKSPVNVMTQDISSVIDPCISQIVLGEPLHVGPFKVLAKVGKVAYRLELPQELSRVHHTFHVSSLKKCYADEPIVMPLEGIHVDDKLQFVEEPVEIMEREIKRLKRSRIPLVKVRWNSRRGPEFTWEREDSFKQKYPQLFTNRASSSTTRS
ncbi:hypothetical protein Tco_0373609 [Tanacetum coccineum]